jgi:putative ABC transport system permease protein
VNELLLQIAAKDVHVDGPVLAAGFFVGVSAAVVAAALPAIRTAGRSIVDSLRRTGTALRPNRRRVRLSDWLGIALIGSAYLLLRVPSSGSVPAGAFATSAALLIGSALLVPWLVRLIHAVASGLAVRVGPSALLASENLVRDLGRTSTTAAALMACVAMTGSFGAYIEGFSQSLSTWTAQRFPGDLYITNADAISGISYRNIPMTETLGRAIRKVRGVADVRALRIARLEYGAYPVKLVASDYDVLARFGSLRMLEGTQAEALDQLRAGGVVVSENFSRHFGVHAGDRITLSTHDGGHAFAVGGVAVDYTSDIGTLLVDRAAYARFWGDTRVDTYEVYVAPGESAAAVRARIRSGPAIGFDLFVLDNAGFRGEITGRLDQVFAVARLLELVAIIVAVLGVVNALLASVLDRVHEIGVVRALGGLRRQVRRSLMIEAALLATAGVLAGVLAGIALGYVVLMHVNLSQTGWYFPYSVPFRTFLETAAVVIASAALAGFLPGWAAARLLIADAVSSDG